MLCGSKATNGLSPPVRGNPRCQIPQHLGCGSIPACAVEPLSSTDPAPKKGVYPRLCGGTPAADVYRDDIRGLSPPVRGNPPLPKRKNINAGSIPACAGEPAWLPGI